MPDSFNNIFLTTENLAFSMPLIIVCVTYVYFKYVPLQIGIPIIVGLFVVGQIRTQFKKQRNKRLTNLDEGAIKSIIGELEEADDKENDDTNASLVATTHKAKNRVQARLALEKKAANKKAAMEATTKKSKSSSVSADDVDEDDAGDLTAFAKSATKTKKKS